MSDVAALQSTLGGFDFSQTARNEGFITKGIVTDAPTVTLSGTTICGCLVDGAVCLAADTRATAGSVVADPNCAKIHYIAENIYCCGAGTAADLEHTTDTLASDLELHRLATHTQVRVCTAMKRLSDKLFRHQGHIGCALVLGGVDINGPQLCQIYPHGSTDSLPFTTMGSGSLAAMAVFEAEYRDGMSIEEGKELVAKAIRSGIFNDLGSGSNVDVCVITKDGHEYLRNWQKPNERKYRAPKKIVFPHGMMPVFWEEIRHLVTVQDGDVEMS
jgi:20S proteasome subunit beta 2